MIYKTPLRLQVNPIECGAIALGIVLEYYGHHMSSYELNKLVGVSRDGSNASALMRAAETLGLKAHAQRVSPGDLKRNKNLSILFVDSSHFVIFEGYFLGRYYINDPALGRYSLSPAQIRRRLSGVQIILTPSKELLKNSAPKKYKIITYCNPLFWAFSGVITGFLLVLLALNSALSLSTKIYFFKFSTAFIVIAFLGFCFFILSFEQSLNKTHSESLRSWLLSAVSHLRPDFFTMRPFESFARALSYANNISTDRKFNYNLIIALSLAIIIILFALYFTSKLIFFTTLVLSAAYLLLALTQQKAIFDFFPSFSQAFEHYPDLSAMGQNQGLIQEQSDEALKNLARLKIPSLNPLFLWLVLPLIFYISPHLLTHEIFMLLELIFIVNFLLSVIVQKLKEPLASYEESVFLEISESREQKPAFLEASLDNLICIKQASFSYPGNNTAIFNNFNITIKANTIYAIKSAPMSGTSTLLKLLGHKLNFNVAHQSIKESLRVALIDDEADLFEGSLLENIRLFERSIGEHEVVQALEHACASELFYKRPMGLLAPIFARGLNLSGGEKKRLLLARALVFKPDLILLDDFFETLEPELAQNIIKNLKNLKISVVFCSEREKEQALADIIISSESFS